MNDEIKINLTKTKAWQWFVKHQGYFYIVLNLWAAFGIGKPFGLYDGNFHWWILPYIATFIIIMVRLLTIYG